MKAYESMTIAGLTRPSGWAPVRLELGIESFGVNGWTAAEVGETVISEHDEVPSGQEELYVVVTGRATFAVDGEEVDAPTGTLVFVRDPAVKRLAVAAEPSTTILAVGGRPHAAYRPRAWETNARVFPLFEQGRHEDAKRYLLDALERYEDRGLLLYNLACAEAQLGESAAALEHLAEAIRERPDLAENAAADDDLASIRGEPGFPGGSGA